VDRAIAHSFTVVTLMLLKLFSFSLNSLKYFIYGCLLFEFVGTSCYKSAFKVYLKYFTLSYMEKINFFLFPLYLRLKQS